MLQIAICDDDPNLIKSLSQMVAQSLDRTGRAYTIYTFSTGADLLKANQHYDVIFLDIKLPGMDGRTVAKKMIQIILSAKIIFVTGYTKYSESTFDVHAFVYLSKPVSQVDMDKQLNDALCYLQLRQKRSRLCLETKQGSIVMDEEELLYFEAKAHKVCAITLHGEHMLPTTMKAVSYKLLHNHHFAFCHQSYCVNLMHVKSLKGYVVYLNSGQALPLAQKRVKEFKERLNVYLHSI